MLKHSQQTHNTLRVLRAAPRAPAVKTASKHLKARRVHMLHHYRSIFNRKNTMSPFLDKCWNCFKGKARQSAKTMTASLVVDTCFCFLDHLCMSNVCYLVHSLLDLQTPSCTPNMQTMNQDHPAKIWKIFPKSIERKSNSDKYYKSADVYLDQSKSIQILITPCPCLRFQQILFWTIVLNFSLC